MSVSSFKWVAWLSSSSNGHTNSKMPGRESDPTKNHISSLHWSLSVFQDNLCDQSYNLNKRMLLLKDLLIGWKLLQPFFFVLFWDWVSLCTSGSSGTYYVDHSSLKPSNSQEFICLCFLSAKIKVYALNDIFFAKYLPHCLSCRCWRENLCSSFSIPWAFNIMHHNSWLFHVLQRRTKDICSFWTRVTHFRKI